MVMILLIAEHMAIKLVEQHSAYLKVLPNQTQVNLDLRTQERSYCQSVSNIVEWSYYFDFQTIWTQNRIYFLSPQLPNLNTNSIFPIATKYARDGTKKVPVPLRDEKPIMGLVSDKNFIVSNAVENILAAPNLPSNKDKDFLKKKNYGKVPKYL